MPTLLKRNSMPSKLATGAVLAFGVLALLAVLLTSHDKASADLGNAATFGVLANTAIDLTGASVVDTDVGISPGSAYTGAGTITVVGAEHLGDTAAADAQTDLATEHGNLAALTCPNDLTGQVLGTTVTTLTPGVYCFPATTGSSDGCTHPRCYRGPIRTVHLPGRNGAHDRGQLLCDRRRRIGLQRLLADRHLCHTWRRQRSRREHSRFR